MTNPQTEEVRNEAPAEEAAYVVARLNSWEDLEALKDDWNALAADIPFQRWEWLAGWWKHFGEKLPGQRRANQLCILCVFNTRGTLVAIAPWWIDGSGPLRTLRALGGGEVCSDYVGVLRRPGSDEYVAAALARWLMDPRIRDVYFWSRGRDREWDLLELEGVLADDPIFDQLTHNLKQLGAIEHRTRAGACWRVEAPETWDAYLNMLSKPLRRKVRRLERAYFDTGRAQFNTATAATFDHAFKILVDLHSRRRVSLGDQGCFASPRFHAFHREAARAMLDAGRLELHWLEVDGQPVAAEYLLSADGAMYAYQAGIDPAALKHEPGHLITIAALSRGIARGVRVYDFLRGDEPYKAHWRAAPRPLVNIRILPGRKRDRIRKGAWAAKDETKRILKAGLLWRKRS